MLFRSIDRLEVYQKYDGHCAYCGGPISLKEMHVDHVIPKTRYHDKHDCLIVNGGKFTEYSLNDIRNLNPACGPCNRWKSAFLLEDFRKEIEEQVARLRKYSASYRMCERYGLVTQQRIKVIFYCELIKAMRGEGK